MFDLCDLSIAFISDEDFSTGIGGIGQLNHVLLRMPQLRHLELDLPRTGTLTSEKLEEILHERPAFPFSLVTVDFNWARLLPLGTVAHYISTSCSTLTTLVLSVWRDDGFGRPL